jgi:CRP-like cAMP-binding protein
MTITPSEALDHVPLFSGVDAGARASLANQLRHVRLSRGETLFSEGDPGAALFIIESGEVRVVSRNGDREVCRLGPGEHVGEMSLIDQSPRSATVIAGCDTTLWRLGSDDFDALCEAHPHVHKQIAATLARRLRDTTQGVTRRRADAVVLLIDVRSIMPGGDGFLDSLLTALTTTSRGTVGVIDLKTASELESTGAATEWSGVDVESFS